MLIKPMQMIKKISLFHMLILFISLFIVLLGSSCNQDNQTNKGVPPTIIRKKDKPVSKSDSATAIAPIINISDTVSMPFAVLYIKDSAYNNIRLGEKLAKIYSEKLEKCIKVNKLTVNGPPMAWYKTQKAPFFFEAAIPVNKKPAKLPKGINFRKIPQTRVIVAHFYGPYEETVQAYQFLKEWLKENKKSPASQPYEIYVDDPVDENGNLKDPYKVQTDIVFPYR
jgi:effector-binding domain-containing protein